MIIAQHRTWFFALTGIIVAASLASLAIFGLKLGIDFTGGTYARVSFAAERPSVAQMNDVLAAAGLHDFSVRAAGEREYDVRIAASASETQQALTGAIASWNAYQGEVTDVSQIGPTIGSELRTKALLSISLVILCILLFIAFAFRKVSRPVSSWVYGSIALITLVHDVIVPVGFFAALGHFFGAEVDSLFVTAILTVLGFSVHDTIVVFDRVRENLKINQERGRKESFVETAGRALNQTFVRSINTSLTVLITLAILYFVGPASTKDFSLTLLVGIIAGTYSSIFLATPLLVEVAERKAKA